MNDHSDSLVLQRIDRKVTEISTALFGIPGDEGFISQTTDTVDAHAKRIGKIEKWMYSLMGALIIIAFLIAHNMITVAAMVKK